MFGRSIRFVLVYFCREWNISLANPIRYYRISIVDNFGPTSWGGYKSKNLCWFSLSDFEFHEWTAKACYPISSYILERSMKKIKRNYLFPYSRCSMNSKSYSRRILTDIFAQLQTQIQSVIQWLFSMCDRQFCRVKAETVHV